MKNNDPNGLSAQIERLQNELEQLRVSAEDSHEEAARWARDCEQLRQQLRRYEHRQQAGQARADEVRARLDEISQAHLLERASQSAIEEELQVALEELQVLAEELDAANNSLREINAQLELRVDQRTEELATTNAELRERDQQLRLALRHAGACSWQWAIGNDALSCSDEGGRLHSSQQPAPSTAAEWVARLLPEDQPKLAAQLQACAEGHSNELALEYRVSLGDGSQRWLASRGRVLTENGRPLRLAGLTTDISERKAAEVLLEDANQQLSARVTESLAAQAAAQEELFQMRKLEALGQLTGGVAHDFNNVLAVISNGLHLLRLAASQDQERLLGGMLKAVDRGAELTRRLLSFGRRQALNPERLDLRQSLPEFHELLRHSLRADVDLEIAIDDAVWPIQADSGELQMALLNLCVNARDAMPEGGVIKLLASNRSLGNSSPMSELARGDYVELSIVDNGLGMSPEVLARVFEPFFTTKDVGQGTGLGLAQVYGFARQSGGTAFARSLPGCGTTISLLLPRAMTAADLSAPAAPSPGQAQPAPGSAAQAHILLVEDDEALAPLVMQTLEQFQHRVTRVGNAQEALQQLQAQHDFDLVFTDVMLPGGLNGLELARTVKQQHPQTAVVITTGYSGEVMNQATRTGMPVLQKPYRPEELATTINRALARRGVAQTAGAQTRH